MRNFPLTPDTEMVAEVTSRFNEDCNFDPAPDAGKICEVLNTAFWASMQSEEGHSVRASLTLEDPDLLWEGIFHFSDPITLSSHAIAKLSASFPFRLGAIGVSCVPEGPPLIWGVVLPKPEHGWLVDILGPGYIVVRNAPRIEAAMLPDGSRISFGGAQVENDWCDLFFYRTGHTLLGKIPFEYKAQFYDLLRVLSRAMSDHRRGGSVVIVDPGEDSWKAAIDFKYEFTRPEEHLSNLVRELRKWQDRWSRNQDRKREGRKRPADELLFYPDSKQERALHEAIRLVGGLTAVDGALVMTRDLKILGYGAKLRAAAKKLNIREWLPFCANLEATKDLQGIGGTRHQSAAQFVYQHPETIILVASQDGRFTIFCGDEAGEGVSALKVELLLL